MSAKDCVVCVNGFMKDFFPEEDVVATRGQIMLTKPIPGFKLKGTFLIHGDVYFRELDGRLLLGGGRHIDKKNEITEEIKNTDNVMNFLKQLASDVLLPNTNFEIEE